jgi:hypothetical protein
LPDAVLSIRADAEIARTDADLEVVVLSADSFDVIERTHGRYSLTPAELVRTALGAVFSL